MILAYPGITQLLSPCVPFLGANLCVDPATGVLVALPAADALGSIRLPISTSGLSRGLAVGVQTFWVNTDTSCMGAQLLSSVEAGRGQQRQRPARCAGSTHAEAYS